MRYRPSATSRLFLEWRNVSARSKERVSVETGGGTEFRAVHCACQVRRMREGETHFCDCDRARATYARPVFFREIGERTSARQSAALAALFARSLPNGAGRSCHVSGRRGDGRE